MAQLLGVSQQTYSKYESGRLIPSADVRARIGAILATTEEAIFPTGHGRAGSSEDARP